MKFIAEVTQDVQVVQEATEDGKDKTMYIVGPFMEYDRKNRNGRVYSESVMRKAVSEYVEGKVKRNSAYGELNHPEGPHINLERACILIKSLEMNGTGQVMGKARITETPSGMIVKGLINSGANLGVSSRGLGSLKENKGVMEVQNDFRLVTASDVVADPSAHSAFVQGIFERSNWIYNETTGEYAEACRNILKKKSMRRIGEAQAHLFQQFLQSLTK